MVHPLLGPEISFQEMAVADLSPAHEDSIGAGLKGFQDMNGVNSARTGQFDDPHRGRVLEPHGARHIGRRVGAVGAHHGDYFRIKFYHMILI